ncbi:MAG: hypothetical protein C5B59_08680 [Bacteroidetes bacterium]|nr:MAG: hypothetical protein C5B59_08680 [Bacteroidota bacterium]
MQPTFEEIQAAQGTRLRQDVNPWDTYSAEMDFDPDITPELQRQIDEYAQHTHENSSNQNKEELARWKEENESVAKEYQWVTPEEYRDEGARVGRPIHSSEFIRMLKAAGVRCWYRTHLQAGKITLVIQRANFEPEVGCWVQLGFMPELSIMRFDEHDVPLDEKFRGWRTCLLQLILKSAISERKADEVFGRPKQTEQFHRYNSTLQSFRNAGNRLGGE